MDMESRVMLIMASLTRGISRMMKMPTTPPSTLTPRRIRRREKLAVEIQSGQNIVSYALIKKGSIKSK